MSPWPQATPKRANYHTPWLEDTGFLPRGTFILGPCSLGGCSGKDRRPVPPERRFRASPNKNNIAQAPRATVWQVNLPTLYKNDTAMKSFFKKHVISKRNFSLKYQRIIYHDSLPVFSVYYFNANILLTFKITKSNKCLFEKPPSLQTTWPSHLLGSCCKRFIFCPFWPCGCLCICMGVTNDGFSTMFLLIVATGISRYKFV